METAMPKNIINTPLENSDEIDYLKKEYERVRENNVNLKLQLIAARKKLQTINQLINTETNGQNETKVRRDATRNY